MPTGLLIDLGNHFSTITDRRWAKDPWGIGLELELLRTGHSEWQEYLKSNADNPIVKAMLRASVVVALGQSRQRDGSEALSKTEILEQAADSVVDKMDPESQVANLAKMKPAVARILIKNARGPAFSDAFWMCGDAACGNRWEATSGQPVPCPKCGNAAPVMDRVAKTFSTEEAVKLFDNPNGADGNPIWVPGYRPDTRPNAKPGATVKVPFGNQPVGDAILAWVLDEVDQTERFFSSYVEAAAKN